AGAFCALMAGAGIRRGHVVGATDAIAGFPRDNPVSLKDVLATVYHLLGVDLETHLHDREGRPVPLVPGGRGLCSVLAGPGNSGGVRWVLRILLAACLVGPPAAGDLDALLARLPAKDRAEADKVAGELVKGGRATVAALVGRLGTKED